MKRLLIVAAAAMMLVGCGADYVIKGNIEGYTGEVKLMANKSTECFATTTTEDGAFTLDVDTKAPLFANLVLGEKSKMIFVEKGEVVVGGSLEDFDSLKVSGTPANEANAAYMEQMQKLVSDYMAATDEDAKDSIVKAYDDHIANTYEANKDNIFGLYLLASQIYYEMTPDEILEAVAVLPKALQKSQGAVTLKNHAEAIKRVEVGQKFIDLELPDKDGNMVKLSDVLAANKYVLLDFWASWCGPCMGEVPYLVADYAEYHPLGFEIYGVSLDKNREPWVKTMESKGLVWPNVSELMYWQDPSAQKYAVRSIPSNFLIASDGTIVARNLRGEALGEKLAELLK
ncbi:MAG: AhpC/TSA family protein [Tidjanibacter sp.]|nr:AhpC/TSA family protein [Tidjanibacter sp.]